MFTEKIRWVGSLATLGIVGALALSACGGAEAPVGAPAAAPTAAAVAPTAVTAAAPTTAPAAAAPASANMLPAEAAAAVTTAITAAKANNMPDAKKSLQAALAQTTDPAQKNALNEVLDDIDKGKTDEVAPDLEKLLAGGAPGREQMETALAAAQKSDWATVKSEVTEAVGIVTDPALKNGLNEILDDLAKNKTDEVTGDLEKLLAGGPSGAPGVEQMQTALTAAQKSDWATVKSEVTEAVGIVTDPALKNGLNEILDDLAKNKTDEVASDLQKLLK